MPLDSILEQKLDNKDCLKGVISLCGNGIIMQCYLNECYGRGEPLLKVCVDLPRPSLL